MRIKLAETFANKNRAHPSVGVGGGGGNAVIRMMNSGLRHVEFCAPTPMRRRCGAQGAHHAAIGRAAHARLGAGGNPSVGYRPRESAEKLKKCFSGLRHGGL